MRFKLLGVLVTSVLTIGLTLATGAASQATTCGAGQIENGGFEDVRMSSLQNSDIVVDVRYNGPGNRVRDEWTGTLFFALAKALPSTDSPVSRALKWQATEGGVELHQHSSVIWPSIYASSDSRPGSNVVSTQWAEIAGLDVNNTLYQSVPTIPGTVMTWTLDHRGRESPTGSDVMQVQIGATLGTLVSQNANPSTGSGASDPTYISDKNAWRTWTGTYVVPAGQTTTVFGFHGVSSFGSLLDEGNEIDNIGFSCDQVLSTASSTKTVTFNSNDGTNTTSTQSSASAANLNGNTFSRSGYTFSGWNTAQNGTGTSYRDQASFAFSSDVPLYAQWTANQSVATPTVSSAALATTGSPNSVMLWLGISSMLAGALFSVSSALNKTRSASTR